MKHRECIFCEYWTQVLGLNAIHNDNVKHIIFFQPFDGLDEDLIVYTIAQQFIKWMSKTLCKGVNICKRLCHGCFVQSSLNNCNLQSLEGTSHSGYEDDVPLASHNLHFVGCWQKKLMTFVQVLVIMPYIAMPKVFTRKCIWGNMHK